MVVLPEDLLVHFHEPDDFCYPEWWAIAKKIEAENLPAKEEECWWRELVITWLGRVRGRLGANYKIFESQSFFLLIDPTDKPAKEYVLFLEQMRKTLHGALRDAVWKGKGRHVVMLFDHREDYYKYIAPFYSEGEHPSSGGVFLQGGGYAHIAAPYNKDSVRRTLVHEYAHNCVAHLPLPRWLNEALAMRLEALLVSQPRMMVDAEAREKHDEHWNDSTIQGFWSGEGWGIPGEGVGLSYQLARVLFAKIENGFLPSHDRLIAFIKQAHMRDAGEAAARQIFKFSLGDLAADFLGKGDWAPQPEKWQAAGQPVKGD